MFLSNGLLILFKAIIIELTKNNSLSKVTDH
jgi:hypothetical protein